MKRSSGFTIVELLIVIVVIGILAAITIVAFNGVQDRARNANMMSLVKQYHKALLAHAAEKGTYAAAATGCLGEGYASSTCWSGPQGTRTQNTTINNGLRPYLNDINPLPAPTDMFAYVGNSRGGISITYSTVNTLDGQPMPYSIVYYLKGTNDCGYPGILTKVNSAYSSSNSNKYTEYNGGIAQCEFALPSL